MSSKSRKKESSILASPKPTKQHIRFDDSQEKEVADHQEKKDDGIVTTSSTSSKEMFSSKSQKRKKKRKRTASTTTTTTTPSSDDNNKMIFNGLILALSTDNKVHQSNNNDSGNPSTKSCSTNTTPNNNNNNNNEEDQYETLKSLKSLLQSHGATISPQVHKRVHYLICTSSAITNLTQRIRQAIKRNVDIVSVDWVRRCIEEDRRVDVTEYICNEKVREIMLEKERDEVKSKGGNKNEGNGASEGYESDIPQDDNNGWSEPIQLDCCCVCHENGDDNCPWCTDCNINLAKKRMKETT